MTSRHEHEPGAEAHCVGLLVNQLGRGNSVRPRLAMPDCENVHELSTTGEQHECFEDTLPDDRPDAFTIDEAYRAAETS